jgi:hypothetical protein
MQHNTLPLVNLQLGEFIYFSCYAAVGLVPPVSSFLFTLLEFYGSNCSTCPINPSSWW